MIAKAHKTRDGRLVVALCDKELIGKKIAEGGRELDLGSEFFKGAEMKESQIGDLLRNSCTCNIVGEKSIALAIKEGIIAQEQVKRIDGVPYTVSSMP